jgi:hypothetical protein
MPGVGPGRGARPTPAFDHPPCPQGETFSVPGTPACAGVVVPVLGNGVTYVTYWLLTSR